MSMRLDRLLSELGAASRSELRQIIRRGRVSVDGAVVTEPERRVDPETSEIRLDGALLSYRRFRYFMMDKPAGVLSITEDRKQRTVLELLPPELKRLELFPVGRLDKDTSGLLLLTNDGDFAHRVISPKSGVKKRYRAETEGIPDEEDARAFAEGLTLGEVPARRAGDHGGRALLRDRDGGQIPPGQAHAGLPGEAGKGAAETLRRRACARRRAWAGRLPGA